MNNDTRDMLTGFWAIDIDTGEELIFVHSFNGLELTDVPDRAVATNGVEYRLGIIRNFNGLEQIVAERVLHTNYSAFVA